MALTATPARAQLIDAGMSARRGGTLTMLVDPEPTALVAVANSADPTLLVSAKVTEGLLSYGFDLEPRPQLATHWSVSDGGLYYTFHLREGVRWHDGAPFTASDVAFSIQVLREVHPRGRTTFANVVAIRTPDPLTAVIELSHPAPFLLKALAACETPIIPRHVYGRSNPTTHRNGEAPIGTGPFLFREWVRGSHVTYERNPDYWDAPKPYLDRVVVRFINDELARVTELETGGIGLAPATPVPLSALNRLKDNPDLVFTTDGYQYTNQVVRLEFNLDDPQFGNKAIRNAIAHVIDRRAIIEQGWLGHGVPALGPISPDLKQFYADDLVTPDFDPILAERLLDDAGLLRQADGVRLRLPLDYVPAGDGYRGTADVLSAALSKIGIVATVRSQEFPAYVRRVYTDREFSFSVSRMNNMFDPSVGVQRVYWSKNFKRGVPFSNGSHYANPIADHILEQAAVEADPTLRRRFFAKFQEIVLEDKPEIALLAPRQITISNKMVIGHTLTADGPAANLADTYLRF